MKTVTISVTADDIRNGVPDDTCNCPVALALRRTFQLSEYGAFVHMDGTIDVRLSSEQALDVKVQQNREVATFVKHYDQDAAAMRDDNENDLADTFEPFTFEIEVPDDFEMVV